MILVENKISSKFNRYKGVKTTHGLKVIPNDDSLLVKMDRELFEIVYMYPNALDLNELQLNLSNGYPNIERRIHYDNNRHNR